MISLFEIDDLLANRSVIEGIIVKSFDVSTYCQQYFQNIRDDFLHSHRWQRLYLNGNNIFEETNFTIYEINNFLFP